MRYVPKPDDLSAASAHISPFIAHGAPNVFLETLKRGDDDVFPSSPGSARSNAESTVVLRLYETFGGHARLKLRIPHRLHVVKAVLTNLLEEEEEDQLHVWEDQDAEGYNKHLRLDFRGFEVKTVKLTIGPADTELLKEQR